MRPLISEKKQCKYTLSTFSALLHESESITVTRCMTSPKTIDQLLTVNDTLNCFCQTHRCELRDLSNSGDPFQKRMFKLSELHFAKLHELTVMGVIQKIKF